MPTLIFSETRHKPITWYQYEALLNEGYFDKHPSVGVKLDPKVAKKLISEKPAINKDKTYSVFSKKKLGNDEECFYCDKYADTKDHFYPKSLGGKLTVFCCKKCNQDKANLIPKHWLMYIQHELLSDEPENEIYLLMAERTKLLISKVYDLPNKRIILKPIK